MLYLEFWQLMSELSVKLRPQRRGELRLLQVTLVPELLRHKPSNLNNIVLIMNVLKIDLRTFRMSFWFVKGFLPAVGIPMALH